MQAKHNSQGYSCLNCKTWVPISKKMGTKNRNHCPNCLWSQHVDNLTSGDRSAICHGMMEPIGLTFKKEGIDKYGKPRQGELMLIHQCKRCQRISINRIAADDNIDTILAVFNASKELATTIKDQLAILQIKLLDERDEAEIRIQIYGRENL